MIPPQLVKLNTMEPFITMGTSAIKILYEDKVKQEKLLQELGNKVFMTKVRIKAIEKSIKLLEEVDKA